MREGDFPYCRFKLPLLLKMDISSSFSCRVSGFKVSVPRFTVCYAPEELKVQACFGQEELVILLEPHLAHSSVLEEMNTTHRQFS